jgi:hypothetical protein
MSTIDPAEFESLRREVAQLRAELGELRQFFQVNPAPAADESGSLHIRCASVSLVSPDSGRKVRAVFELKDGSPRLRLRSADEKTRVSLELSGDEGWIHLRDADGKTTVQILTDPEGHGNVVVHSPGGVPRAGMKGIADGGVVSVSAPDGSALAVMHSTKGEGEFSVFNNDSHKIARMGTAEHGHGTMGILNKEGNRACVMIAVDGSNGLIVYDPAGEEGISNMATSVGSVIECGKAVADQLGSVTLTALHDGRGRIELRDPKGNEMVTLGSDANGGHVVTHATDGSAAVELSIHENGGRLQVIHGDDIGKGVVCARPEGAVFIATGGADHQASLQLGDGAPSLLLRKPEQTLLATLPADPGQSPSIAFLNKDRSPTLVLEQRSTGGAVSILGNEGASQFGVAASDIGGNLALFSELGVERVTLSSKGDGGSLRLKWGGTNELIAAATDRGGCLVTYDPREEITATMPENLPDPDGEEEEE